MSGDIVEQLRALARAQHDDLSIGIEAADEIERLTRERDEARAEVERLRAEKDKLREIDRLVRRLVRRRMAEAWDEGNISPGHLKDNPYRKKRAEP